MLSLITDAKAAGYTVETEGTATLITKRMGRWHTLAGLCIHADGTAFDISVDLTVAKGIRSYKHMRQLLSI
jgi:hypothetical protein